MSLTQPEFHYQFSDAASAAVAIGGQAYKSDGLPFDLTRFTVGTHQSRAVSDDSFLLILPIRSKGFVEAEIGSEKSAFETHTNPLTFAPRGAIQTYDFRGVTDNVLISLDADFVEKIAEEWGDKGAHALLDPVPNFKLPRVAHLMLDMYRMLRTADAGWRTTTEAAAMQIAVELFRFFAGEKNREASATPEVINFDSLDEYIDAHMDCSLNLSDLAVSQEMNVFSFSRAFRSKTGMTPGQFIIERRVERACRLLSETDTQLAEIAYSCGFSSQSHMTSTFSKYMGTTPGRYRKEARS
ncbi:MAG: AraC family transcriptional regulator [Pseudomonadota bacterium]